MQEIQRRWSTAYRTAEGFQPVPALRAHEADHDAAILAALTEVMYLSAAGLEDLRCAGTDMYETRAAVGSAGYRILFALEPRNSRVVLGLVAVRTKRESWRGELLSLAQQRLAEYTSSKLTV